MPIDHLMSPAAACRGPWCEFGTHNSLGAIVLRTEIGCPHGLDLRDPALRYLQFLGNNQQPIVFAALARRTGRASILPRYYV